MTDIVQDKAVYLLSEALLGELEVAQDPNDVKCFIFSPECTKQAVYKIRIDRPCDCDSGEPFFACLEHTSYIKSYGISCTVCEVKITVIDILPIRS